MLPLGCVNSQEGLLMGIISQECCVYNITLSPSHVSVLSVPLTTFLTTPIFFIWDISWSVFLSVSTFITLPIMSQAYYKL